MTTRPFRVVTLVGLSLGLTLSSSGWAATPADPDIVRIIEANRTPTGGLVIVHGTRPPVFSVFRLSAPDRIVVDLAGADVSQAKTPTGHGIPGLEGISAVQFQKGDSRIGRVILAAAGDVRYEVKVEGADVLVSLTPAAETLREFKAPVSMPPAPAAAERRFAEVSSEPAADPHVVDRREDRADPVHPGHRIVSASVETRAGRTRLAIRTDGPVGTFTVLRLRDPARVAIDLEGFKVRHARSLGHGEIRFGSGASSGRVVLDLEGEQLPEVQAVRSAHGLAMTLVRTSPTAVASKREKIPPVASRHEEAPRSAPLAVAEPARPLASAAKVKQLSKTVGAKPSAAREVASVEAPTIEKRRAALKDLRISGDSSGETVVIELPAGASAALPQVTKVGEGRFQLSLDGVPVPSRLQRTLDASAFGGPIATVSAYNVGSGRDHGRVIVSAAPGGSQQLRREGSRMIWSFIPAPPSTAAQASATLASAALAPDSVTVQESSGEAAGFTTAAGEAAATSPRRARYTGRRISMEFKDIDIQNLLRLFAEISHRNIVVSDDVKGKVTIALRNVPWDQAFDLILKTHGLGKEEVGNIIRIAPEAELEKERKQAIEAQRARQQLEPLKVRLIPVNYALAADVADKIKDVLSDRGIVTVDQRTNVLIVKDVVDNLAKAEGMVRNLDTQTPQVLIESRIVEAATTFAREIGIQWGGNGGFSPVTANTTGLVFPSLATVAGGAGDAPNAGTGAVPNFAVNLPAAIGPGSGGGLGFIFGSAGGAFNLNLRLSALENNGVVKTVSAPKVATLDNQEAAISQGLSIPFAQVSAAGVQTAFIEARLELKVTPHVTADGSILMKLSASNNQPNAGITGANGQPSISRKEAKTQMLVKDGDTTVIGGIYTRSTGTSVNEVPFFGKIPILGWLFKHRADSDNRTELLIFITPRILNRQQVVSAGAGG